MDVDFNRTGPADVSIVIPTHNRPALMAAAVRSVTLQDWPSWECIVVDDGSEPQVRIEGDDPRIRVVRRQTAGGPAAARNAGIGEATGLHITFLDDDDLLAPSRLRIGIEALRLNPMANCHVGTLVWARDPDLREIPDRGATFTERQLRIGSPYVGQVLMRRGIVEEFDEELRTGEDVEWWLRVEPAVVPVITDHVVAVIRIHDGPRPGVSTQVRLRSTLRAYHRNRHQMALFGHVRSRQLRRVADAALASGRPSQALGYALAATIARPDMRKLKLTARAFLALIRGLAPS